MHHRYSGETVKQVGLFDKAVDPIEVFREQWGTYQTVVRENYMFHREISYAFRKMLDTLQGPFKVLDLGCGDACQVGEILNPDMVAEYLGCDLSDQALDIARHNLAPFRKRFELHCKDMLSMLKKSPDRHFDVVYSCYALHHLPFEQKQVFFIECCRVMSEKGVFILADIMREEGESTERYYDRYITRMKKDWLELTDNELASIQGHIECCDYPETSSVLRSLAFNAGMKNSRRLEKCTWHQAWCYRA